MMAASLRWLFLFLALFPAVLGQKLDIDVAIGETAKLPLRSFTDFDDSKALGLIQVNDTSNPYTYEELLTLAAGAPVQNAIIHEKWQGRLSLLDGPDGIVAELRNVQPSDTGRKVYCQYQQAGHQGPKMYINLRTPPPSVSSFSITDVGEDYANITFQQVEPLDSTPVEYYVEYREAGVSSSDSWQQTGRVPHNTSITNQLITVEGLRTGVRYQFRVVSSNRFGESYSHIEEAGTMEPQKSNGSGLNGGVIAVIIIVVLVIIFGATCICYKYWQRIREGCCNRDLESGDDPNTSTSPTKETDSGEKETEELEQLIKEDNVGGTGHQLDAEPMGANTTDTVDTSPTDQQSQDKQDGKAHRKDLTNSEDKSDAASTPAPSVNIYDNKGLVLFNYGNVYMTDTASQGSREDVGKVTSTSPNAKEHSSAPGQFYLTLLFQGKLFTSWDPNDPKNREIVDKLQKELAKLIVDFEVKEIRKGSVIVIVLIKCVQREMETIKATLKQAVTGGDLAHIGVDPQYFYTYDHYPETTDNLQGTRSTEGQSQDDQQVVPPIIPPEPTLDQKTLLSAKKDYAAILEVLKKVDQKLFWQCCDEIIKAGIIPPLPKKLTAQDLKTVDRYRNVPYNYLAIETTGNGDCLFNAVSLLLTGTEDHAALLRLGAAVYAGLNVKYIVKELSASGKASDDDTALAFMNEVCAASVSQHCPFTVGANNPKGILEYAVMEEARVTTKLGVFSGWLQIKFLSGFVQHNIHLSCEDPEKEICGYHNVLQTPSPYGDNLPELRIMMVYANKESTSLNHYVGLVKKPKGAGALAYSVAYDEVTRMAEREELDGEEQADRKFVARVAEELGISKKRAEDLKQRNTNRRWLVKLAQEWQNKYRSTGSEKAALLTTKFERALAAARRSMQVQLPSDVEIDASKEDSEAEITGEVTGPPANVNNVESAAMNNLSQTGQEENKTVGSQDTCNSSVHDALLLYEENDRDDDREEIRKIIQMLQSWGVSLCDPYNRGQYDQMEVFAQSLEESRHAVVFLTQKVLENIKENRKDQTTFRMSTFLCKMLNEHVQIGSQQLVPVKLADGETPSILMAFNMLNPKTKGFERKLFKSFTKPGGLPDHLIQQKVKDMKRMCQLWKEEDRTKLVKQLASDKYLDIPLDVVSNILQEFGGFTAKLEEVLRCWRSRNGEEATEAAIDAAIQELKAQQNDSSIGSDQTTKAEADAVTRVVKEEDFQEIQEHIGSKWKNVARRLGLSEGQIDCIMHDYEEQTLDEKVYQMLLKWKKLKGESATVAVLIQALQQEGLPNVADKIEN